MRDMTTVFESYDPRLFLLVCVILLCCLVAVMVVDVAYSEDNMVSELKVGQTVWQVIPLTSMYDGRKLIGFTDREARVISFSDDVVCISVHVDYTAFAKPESLFATEEEAIAEIKRRNEQDLKGD